MRIRNSRSLVAVVGLLVLTITTSAAFAQLSGHNTKGDFGLMSGSQAPPGWYLSAFYLRYDGEALNDRHGRSIGIDPDRRGSLDVNAYALGLLRVTEHKLFGGTYAFVLFPAFTDNSLEIPILDSRQSVDTGFTDLYVQPINLGWHKDRADYTAGIGIFAPTGSYSPDSDDNTGLGMWSLELFAGTTLYFDEAKSWHFATTAFYETHGEKDGTRTKVGDILTLEGGLGKSFMDGAVTVGLAYFAQWKVSDDRFGEEFDLPEGLKLGRHEVFGVGPEFTIPLATSKKLIGFLNVRYFWESGARTTTEGSTFNVTVTFPIPSVALE